MAKVISRRLLIAVGIFLLLAVVVPFINANRLKNRFAESLSAAINRPVTMGDVSLRLLPQPGFYVQNLTIGDDPAFSSEPMLRAESMTASLRLSSLWRGRLEVAKLSFAYPSMNLVRREDGRWNVEGLLMRASQVSTAPTARRAPQTSPRFPYIEVESGRINFKLGNEKLAHTLVETDLALWLESENEWNVRLEARPTRTDANLSDTGTIKVEGSFQRADSLLNTPFKLRLNVERAQLGQLSTLVQGKDRGWRGNLDGTIDVEGSVADFRSQSDWQLTGFRRYDISNGTNFSLSPRCQVVYGKSAAPEHSRVTCQFQVEPGSAVVERIGSPQGVTWKVLAEKIPARKVAELAVQTKRGLPADLSADGSLNALFMRGKEGVWSGEGRFTGLSLRSEAVKQTHSFGEIVFSIASLGTAAPSAAKNARPPANLLLQLQPFSWDLGGIRPLTVSGALHGKQGEIFVRGDADLAKATAAARLFGIQIPEVPITGSGTIDLMAHVNAEGFQPPSLTGKTSVRKATIQLEGINVPVDLTAATVILVPNGFQVTGISAAVQGTKTGFSGSVSVPYPCTKECISIFDLRFSELDIDDINRVVNPRFRQTNWLALPGRIFGGREADAKRLRELRAEGTLTARKFTARAITADNVTAKASVSGGVLRLSELRGDVSGGKHQGGWVADFSGNAPSYSGGGNIQNASASSLMRTSAPGRVNLRYQVWFAGSEAAALADSMKGQGDFTWTNGALPRAGAETVSFSTWSGKLEAEDRKLRLTQGQMSAPGGSYDTTGEIGFDRSLSLKLDGPRLVEVSGAVDQPVIKVSASRLSNSESASNSKNASSPKASPPQPR